MGGSDDIQYFGKDLEAMSFADNYHRWILAELQPYLGKSVAEVGAGNGNFSAFLLETELERLVSFEPSNNMFADLERRFAGNQRIDTIRDFFGNRAEQYHEAFDSVMYINVLEHIEDDGQELRYAFQTLRPGGHILLFVPALSFLYSELDRKVGHFRRYGKRQLVEVVRSAGFDIDRVRFFDIAGILPWYVAFVLLKSTTNAANVSLYDRLVVPVMRPLERFIRPPIGKNLLLIGRKPAR
ncbi:MAG: class I SAM-dependent methyltransferase [Chromatiales bacterium]|nr:class I SAM-dependent methyltransferase [Chromatiales bacterium]